MDKIATPAQISALRLLAEKGPLKRGFFSGWGPHKYGYAAHRIDLGTPTANVLLRKLWAEVVQIDNEDVIRITGSGRAVIEPTP